LQLCDSGGGSGSDSMRLKRSLAASRKSRRVGALAVSNNDSSSGVDLETGAGSFKSIFIFDRHAQRERAHPLPRIIRLLEELRGEIRMAERASLMECVAERD